MMLSRIVAAHQRRLRYTRGPHIARRRENGLSLSTLAVLQSLSLDSVQHPTSASPSLFQQVRWKRKGGASAFSKPRPPTQKQRKQYARRQREIYHETVGKHSDPGSKAGPRREAFEERWQELLDWDKPEPNDPSEEEYGYGDALLDDMMGNTSGYTSIPTPEPTYLGHKHKKYFKRVKEQMEQFRVYQQQQLTTGESLVENGSLADLANVVTLPTDHSISLLLRAYRDRKGTKSNPIGIVKALKHLLTDLSLPVAAFGEETYTSLMTCCRTPKEARRIFRLMKENQHPVSSYSWSILVDIHAKLGDPEGCDAVIREMASEGVAPSLAAYTSLLAACYKICNAGHFPPAVRAKAGKLGWEKWKEMRIVGLEPDVMAYGALLRLCAARGHPERAINVLEEMQAMGVKPTTLCFTSALRSVARSHQTAVRYERGDSKKNMRRENVAAHHGKLAREIVIQAEVAEVEQDEGFTAALMQCAAAAGDSATAKAIFLASEVRKMDHLRPIGSKEHLDMLKDPGHDAEPQFSIVDSQPSFPRIASSSDELDEQIFDENALQTLSMEEDMVVRRKKRSHPSFGEREYGPDSRMLSMLLHACSKAIDTNGIGTMWAGRENKGYLCDNSLRLLVARPQPRYQDTSVPGLDPIEVGRGTVDWHDEPEVLGKRLRRARFEGMQVNESVGSTIEDIDPDLFSHLMEEADPSEKCHIDLDATREKYIEETGRGSASSSQMASTPQKEAAKEQGTESQEGQIREEWYFDYDVMRWKTRSPQPPRASKVVESSDTATRMSSKDTQIEEEWYFDDDVMRWKTRPRHPGAETSGKQTITRFEAGRLFEEERQSHESSPSELVSSEEDFQEFFRGLKDEIKESGEDILVDEAEARKLFSLASSDFPDLATRWNENNESGEDSLDFEAFYQSLKEEFGVDEDTARELFDGMSQNAAEAGSDEQQSASDLFQDGVVSDEESDFESFYQELKGQLSDDNIRQTMFDDRELMTASVPSQISEAEFFDMNSNLENQSVALYGGDPLVIGAKNRPDAISTVNGAEAFVLQDLNETNDPVIAELQLALPGMPVARLEGIRDTFEKSLNSPSILELVPLLRENMPDFISPTWLRKKNLQNASYVMQRAEEEKTVDLHMLNGMLEVKTSAGSIDAALAYHNEEFSRHGQTPTAYSDRLVLQMLVQNNRLPRALHFKQQVEGEGRRLDALSYGTLVEYYSRRGQLGSAMMLLEECISVHSSSPGEKTLTPLRLLCRQNGLVDRVEALAGKDPLQWLKHGETNLKREMSKKGRRNVQYAINRLVDA